VRERAGCRLSALRARQMRGKQSAPHETPPTVRRAPQPHTGAQFGARRLHRHTQTHMEKFNFLFPPQASPADGHSQARLTRQLMRRPPTVTGPPQRRGGTNRFREGWAHVWRLSKLAPTAWGAAHHDNTGGQINLADWPCVRVCRPATMGPDWPPICCPHAAQSDDLMRAPSSWRATGV